MHSSKAKKSFWANCKDSRRCFCHKHRVKAPFDWSLNTRDQNIFPLQTHMWWRWSPASEKVFAKKVTLCDRIARSLTTHCDHTLKGGLASLQCGQKKWVIFFTQPQLIRNHPFTKTFQTRLCVEKGLKEWSLESLILGYWIWKYGDMSWRFLNSHGAVCIERKHDFGHSWLSIPPVRTKTSLLLIRLFTE